MSLVAEGHWGDAKVLKALVLGVAHQVLGLYGQELWVHPLPEKFSVWGDEPWMLLILESLLVFHLNAIWLNLGNAKELLINLFVGVGVWTSKLVGLAHGLLRLDAIIDGESNIVGENWLDFSVHAFDHKIHSVEHFHLHTPL